MSMFDDLIPDQPASGGAFNTALSGVLDKEGGYSNNPDDRGGETIYGVSSKYFPQDVQTLKDLTAAHDLQGINSHLHDFYKNNFWDKIGGDSLPPDTAYAAFDTAVQHGVEPAKKMLAAAGGDPQKLLAARQQYMSNIVANDPTQAQFAQGWGNRIKSVGDEAAAMQPQSNGNATAQPSQSGGMFDDLIPGNAAKVNAPEISNTPQVAGGSGMFDDLIPANQKAGPTSPEPSYGDVLQQAFVRGFTNNLQAAKQAGQLAHGQVPELSAEHNDEINRYLTEPYKWGTPDFKKIMGKTMYGLTEAAPEMAGAIAGGVGGTAAVGGPENPAALLAGPAGAGLGAAGVNYVKTLAPTFAQEIKAHPGDPDAAWQATKVKAGIGAAGTGAAFALFEFAPFEGAVKNLLFQVAGVQPAVGAGQQAAQNIAEGKPVGEGVGQAAVESAAGTAIPLGAHTIMHAVTGHGEAPAPAAEASSQAPEVPASQVKAPASPTTGMFDDLIPTPAAAVNKTPAPVKIQEDAAQKVQDGQDGQHQGTQKLITPNGEQEINAAFDVVDAKDLKSSDHPDFPQELQPRDRSRKSSDLQVNDIANKLDTQRLGASRTTDTGAPIIGPDNLVESGNGRVMGIRKAYNDELPSADKYRAFIEDQGYDTSGMDAPVLVRRRQTELSPEDRVKFTIASNERTGAAMSSTERAMADAKNISDDMASQYQGGDITSPQNRPYLKSFMETVPGTDRGSMIGPDGQLSQDGLRRARGALLAKAYADPDIVQNLTENPDSEIKGIGNAMTSVAGKVAGFRADVRKGDIPAGLDITDNFIDAAKRIRDARANNKPVSDILNQQSMFENQSLSPVTEKIIRAMYTDNLKRPVSAMKIEDFMRKYYDEAAKAQSGPNLLGMDEVKPEDILSIAAPKDKTEPGQDSLDLINHDRMTAAADKIRENVAKAKSGPEKPLPDVTPQSMDALEKRLTDEARASGKAGADTAPEFGKLMRQAYENLMGRTGGKESLRRIVEGNLGEGLSVRGSEAVPKKQKMRSYGQDEKRSGLRSSLLDAADNLKQRKGTGEQMLGILKNQPGVKGDEIAWTGLDEYLKGKKSVTKEDVQDYLKNNQVKIKEVTLDGNGWNLEVDEDADPGQPQYVVYDPNGKEYGRYERSTTAQSVINSKQQTKFSQHTLPGGTNYREVLLTLPAKDKITTEKSKSPEGWGDTEGGNEGVIRRGDTGADFRSGHFEQPNILAHLRLNDRIDADGKKTLFMEEMQSDWHQRGRKQGYQEKLTDEQRAALEKERHDLGTRVAEIFRETEAMSKDRLPSNRMREESRWHELMKERDAAQERAIRITAELQGVGKVPDAPFKKTWHEMAFRRVAQMAADQGYDKVAWTTGDQQAERYDLSKQISKIEYFNKGEQEKGVLRGYDLDGKQVINQTVRPDKLEDYIGKETAKKLLESQSDKYGMHQISGDGLKLGGEGMKGFYDKILPQYANKFGKKFDAKVGETEIINGSEWKPFERDDGSWGLKTPSDGFEASPRFTSKKEALSFLRDDARKVHSLDITPAMRESAQRGFELFQPGKRGAVSFMPDGRTIINMFEKADKSTLFHEAGHIFLDTLQKLAAHAEAPDGIRKDWQAISKWLGVKDGADLSVAQHEKFARGFERYLRDGKAPSAPLRAAFEKMKNWLRDVYKSVKDLNVTLTPEVRDVMDRLLAGDEQIKEMKPINDAQAAHENSLQYFQSEIKKKQESLDDFNKNFGLALGRYKRRIAGETKADVRQAQGEFIKLLEGSDLTLNDRAKFIRAIKNIQTLEQLQKRMPGIQQRISKLIDADNRRQVRGKLDTLAKRYAKPSIRKKIGTDIEQVDQLLDQYGLRRGVAGKQARQAESLNNWYKAQLDAGYEPLIDPSVLAEKKAPQDYKELPTQQLADVYAALRNIEEVAKQKREVTIDGRKADLSNVVDAMTERMQKRGEKFTKEQLLNRPKWHTDNPVRVALSKMAARLRLVDSSLRPQDYRSNKYDNHEILGPFHQAIFNRLFNRNYWKTDKLAGISNDFSEKLKELGPKWQKSLHDLVDNKTLLDPDLSEKDNPVYMKLTRGQMLGIARHVGSESNFSKLTRGMDWDGADVLKFLDQHMTPKDVGAVQAEWAQFEPLWQESEAMLRRLGAQVPEKIPHRPIEIAGVKTGGGYVPIDYDPVRSKLARRLGKIDPNKSLSESDNRDLPSTSNRSLIERNEAYADRINLDYHYITQALKNTVHDVAYREALIDANKIVNHPKFELQFKKTFGPEEYNQFKEFLSEISNMNRRDSNMNAIEHAIQYSRQGIIMTGVGYRLSTVLKHGSSAALKSFGGLQGPGRKYLLARIARMATINAAKDIAEAKQKFPEIRARLQRMDRDYSAGSHTLYEKRSWRKTNDRVGHAMVAWSDALSAIPTAHAAYDWAITEGIPEKYGGTGKPMSERDAIDFANKTVREAHGSANETARSNFLHQRGIASMLGMIYQFMNNTYGQITDIADKAGSKASNYKSPGGLTAKTMAQVLVPAVAAYAIGHGINDEPWYEQLAKAITGELAGTVPLLRDGWSMAEAMMEGRDPSTAGAELPPVRVLGDVGVAVADAVREAKGNDTKIIQDAGNAIGEVLHISGLGQAGKTGQYLLDVDRGKKNPKDAMEMLEGLTIGAPRDGTAQPGSSASAASGRGSRGAGRGFSRGRR